MKRRVYLKIVDAPAKNDLKLKKRINLLGGQK